ncbi:unnamed protein product [Arabidopsis thaliana]|uniref:Uncharacterized protein n=1 Tax=Arabidopsis thaliana TaxID=3702 RepID=A0A5S9XH80_ARATH|nr:unnamed protein product [Arabidopsis thaliana]
MPASGPSKPVEPEVITTPVKTLEPTVIPPEVTLPMNTEDGDDSEPRVSTKQPTAEEVIEPEQAAVNLTEPESVQNEA